MLPQKHIAALKVVMTAIVSLKTFGTVKPNIIVTTTIVISSSSSSFTIEHHLTQNITVEIDST